VGNAETCAEPRLGRSVDFVPEVDPEPLSTLFIPASRLEIATSWDQRLGAYADIAHRSVRTNHRRGEDLSVFREPRPSNDSRPRPSNHRRFDVSPIRRFGRAESEATGNPVRAAPVISPNVML
jgi:hypothetical protein